jgi:hypothetical protein
VIYGKKTGFDSFMFVSDLRRVQWLQAPRHQHRRRRRSGRFGCGDVNGDGFADILVGAQSSSPNGTYSGSSYVFFGGDFNGILPASWARLGTTLGAAAPAACSTRARATTTITVTESGPVTIDGGSGTDVINLDAAGPSIVASTARAASRRSTSRACTRYAGPLESGGAAGLRHIQHDGP